MSKVTTSIKNKGYDWERARRDNERRNQPKPTPRASMNGNQ